MAWTCPSCQLILADEDVGIASDANLYCPTCKKLVTPVAPDGAVAKPEKPAAPAKAPAPAMAAQAKGPAPAKSAPVAGVAVAEKKEAAEANRDEWFSRLDMTFATIEQVPIPAESITEVDSRGEAPPGSAIVKGKDNPPAHSKEFCRRALDVGVLTLDAIEEFLLTPVGKDVANDWRELSRAMVEAGLITRWQRQQIVAGWEQQLRLDRYLLLDHLGDGGMGSVYKARHALMDRLVAIKVVRKGSEQDRDALSRFKREVAASVELHRHPNFVEALDVAEDGQRIILVLEFIDGPNLHNLVKQEGPLPIAVACDCIRQAALGLAHAHKLGMIHRDVKPSNLLLARSPKGRAAASWGTVKVADMGLVRFDQHGTSDAPPWRDDGVIEVGGDSGQGIGKPSRKRKELSKTITHSGAMMGTPAFMAPEQAFDSHTADVRSDIYSLGASLFFLLTGSPPNTNMQFSFKNLSKTACEPPPRVRAMRMDCPESLDKIVLRLLDREREKRPKTAEAVAALLEPFTDPSRPPPEDAGAEMPAASARREDGAIGKLLSKFRRWTKG